jgi:Ras family protein T1
MDLFLPSSTAGVTDEQVLARSRQQIVSLMQRFRFIRQCIKCSAKNLLRVDEVFLKAQQAVLYPFTPLYDLDVGRLSEDCQRAFTRIFRMYDRDHDGLLSHHELDRFQHETFHVPVYERDLTGWKKVVSRNNPNEEVVRDGKFTVSGFLAIFDVFISQNRLDVPWQALRKFGYDDNLNLIVPASVFRGTEDASWTITPSAQQFLADLFNQYDSDQDGVLSLSDMDAIFSIIPESSLPPWHPIRSRELFGRCFSQPNMPIATLPRSESMASTASSVLGISQSLSASGITIVSGDSFPSVDMSSVDRVNVVSTPLTFLEWMGLWHSVSAISPEMTRAELFRLGHIEDTKTTKRRKGRKKSAVAPHRETTPDSLLPSRQVRVLLLGSPGSGKTALINSWCGGGSVKDPLETTKTKSPETSCTYVRLKRQNLKSGKGDDDETVVVHLVVTEVPEAEAEYQALRRKQLSKILSEGGCDLVVLAFDCNNSASLAYATHLESSLLNDDVPRVYVGTKSDQCRTTTGNNNFDAANDVEDNDDDHEWQASAVIDEAATHCRSLDLEPPLVTSVKVSRMESGGPDGVDLAEHNRRQALECLARCCLYEPDVQRLRGKPHEERKRREASRRRNRKMIWFGVGVGVAVAVVGYLWTGGASGGGKSSSASGGSSAGAGGGGGGRLGWFRTLFSRSDTGS